MATMGCTQCRFHVYIKGEDENNFKMVPYNLITGLEKAMSIDAYTDQFGYQVTALDKGSDYIIEESTFSFYRCPKCQTIFLYKSPCDNDVSDDGGNSYQYTLTLESKERMAVLKEVEDEYDQYVMADVDFAKTVAREHLENTLLEPLSVQCPCGCSHGTFENFDYLVFPFHILLCLIELEDENEDNPFKNHDKMEIMRKISYQAYECKECRRMTIIGKDRYDHQFKAVYKPVEE